MPRRQKPKDHGDATHREFDFLDKSEGAMQISMWCQWYDDIHSHFGVNYQRGSEGEVHVPPGLEKSVVLN